MSVGGERRGIKLLHLTQTPRTEALVFEQLLKVGHNVLIQRKISIKKKKKKRKSIFFFSENELAS